MTASRRILIVAAILAAIVTPVLAQPPRPSGPNDAFKMDPQTTAQYIQRIVSAAEVLKARYDAAHRDDPSAPDFEAAATDAMLARESDLMDMVLQNQELFESTLPNDNTMTLFKGLQGGRQFASYGRQDQEAFAGEALRVLLQNGRANNRINEIIFTWFARVLDRMAFALPEGDPARAIARRDLDSAELLLSYDSREVDRVFDRADDAIRNDPDLNGTIADAIVKAEQADPDLFRQRRTSGPEEWTITGTAGGRAGHVYINERGEIGASVRLGVENGEETLELREFRRAGTGEITNAERDRAVAYIREHFPYDSRRMIRQFDSYILRINLAYRRRAASGAGAGGTGEDGEGGGGSFLPSVFDDFLDIGGTITTVQMEQIYPDYDPFDPFRFPGSRATRSLSSAGTSLSSVGWSLSSAGTSLSSVGWSLSAAGTSLSSVGTSLDYGWGGGISLAGSPTMSFAGGPIDLTPSSATTVTLHSAWNGLYQDVGWNRATGGYGVIRDPSGRLGEFSADSRLAGFVSGLTREELIRILRTSGLQGLQRLLAQPFNVLLTWGPNAYDIDLHMTGPSGTNDGTRFHIYYAAPGSQTAFPFAQLIRDCICTSGSEVILMARLLQGGVYRISAFNYGNQSTTSTQLTTNADLQLLIVRGGAAVSVGNGTTIQGGTVVFRGTPTPGQAGNTWVGVEIDPRTGQIRFVDRANNSANGDGATAPAGALGQRQVPPEGRAGPTHAIGLTRSPVRAWQQPGTRQ